MLNATFIQKDAVNMFLLTILGVGSGIAHSIWSGYTYTRGRKVTLGRVRLLKNSPLGTHWAVQVDNKYWKPYWYEIDGKISYAQWYATTNIVLSHGDTSLSGAEPTQDVGCTKKTDDDIKAFNEEWKKEHPEYHLMSDNCQMYATDLIKYLCGPDAENNLPWQEGRVVVQTSLYTMSSIATIGILSISYWAISKVVG